ncbi:MAG: bifunctional [glutamine synthetase] adenylyltransferase/[glutamine synthetase]-adenylyl-L-tyrosine phosphorylase [Caulobacteraceae bacterium]|nr:bifunctional [glutamine synthetase] adenylyltransferase/[glutamine synthetase]-adenylyl-L-tyrosine phosphorylase [Caulobacteraceae bacterium]
MDSPESLAPLAQSLRPCGPVIDLAAVQRAFETLTPAAAEQGWSERLAEARAALEPVFSASPYLASLARQRPPMLGEVLAVSPEASLTRILATSAALEAQPGTLEAVGRSLRRLKGETHLVTALADLGGVWDLDQVTGALTRFADAALRAALAAAARAEIERGRLRAPEGADRGPIPGFFCIAMGKYGAFELNYSSDIDFSVFFDPLALPLAGDAEPQALAVRLTQTIAELLQARTPDGYVFRVDLRLRPDPSSTPLAAPVAAAMDYYESVGQNWERAAYIKARVAAGDMAAGQAFLDALQPFIWRRNLDFAAIADIHSIKRQIHVHKVDERMVSKGADLKLGHGGIREIEFYAQTQQLILGGRDPGLRASRTLDALQALARAGHVAPATADELSEAYRTLRALEHRAQMVGDHQTHKLPEADADRRRIAALFGEGDLRRFDAAVGRLLRSVNARYGELFADDEDLSSKSGSLVFTGVEDDPETLKTLHRMGFSDPAKISGTIRAWHHGRIAATRTERGRELFTRLAPRLLEAAQATGASDEAFKRFADFFSGLSSGVQVQSLFLAQPKLFELVVEVMAFAPRLAMTLARHPTALDAMLDGGFFQPIAPGEHMAALEAAIVRGGPGFEAAMDAARRVHREQSFRIGLLVMSGAATAAEAGPAFADLADACIRALAPVALAETHRLGGDFPGAVAVVALGRCGSREMTAASDLDLMTVYRADDPQAMSVLKGWGAETVFSRFTQRLIAALSAPTAEGGLYEVDMRLRPSGTAGPVAVSAAAFGDYYATEAETWEFLALTRARVVWASRETFAQETTAAIDAALRQPREPVATARDVREMRELMAKERPPFGFWDLKLSPGGLIDIEFVAQYLQIIGAAGAGPLNPHTGEALAALAEAHDPHAAQLTDLAGAWTLQQDLSQLLAVALEKRADPAAEPKGFRARLARAGQSRTFPALEKRLTKARAAARSAYEALIPKA